MKLSLSSPTGDLDFIVSKKVTTIGREESCDWIVKDKIFSGRHCSFYWDQEKNQFAIMDLNSKNGVSVDGARIPPDTKVRIDKKSFIQLANVWVLRIETNKKEELFDLHPTSAKKKEEEILLKSNQKKSQENSLKKVIALVILLALIWFFLD
jgi:pSer/pThr/pTyr-binding forkhead associated (FHA) protein